MDEATVVLSRWLPDSFTDTLAEKCRIVRPAENEAFSREELLAAVGACDAILAVGDRIDEAVFAAAPRCRVVANFGVGYNNIDVAAATSHGIWVTNTPDVVTDATADLAWALLLAAARRLGECDRLVRAGQWDSWGPLFMLGRDVSGAMLGIVGGGRIGLAMAKRALGFNMDILYTANSPKPDFEKAVGGRFVPLPTLLRESDFVSLHVPLTEQTRHLIGAPELAMMKKTAVLVNTARGPVVDEKALVDALEARAIAAAGLDVFEREPQVEPGLLKLDNVVLAPHVGSATLECRTGIARMACRNILAALRNDLPPNCLNPEARKR
ncbi:2-hydroxyacid dehydrogenase [Anaeroselena agilis]|uniref:D-glycerate dehydrogenase n=1 Tax=Anaeroselena agilis TaxID=3063788 RepID=A0ABU3NSY5_9FIRM|nr:D-glycerate dehydrogenase [Selenomonadales bacterium 4137-cl]